MLVYAIIASLVSFTIGMISTKYLIRYLTAKGSVVKDYHKPNNVMVPRPGGLAIAASLLITELILFVLTLHTAILAITISTAIAFVIGYVDDKRVMGGYYKPLALIISALPIILLGTFDTNLEFPFFGSVRIPLLYIGLIAVMIPVMGNTINSIDVLNGVVSSMMIISGIALFIALLIRGNIEIAVASLPLIFSAVAFYRYHKYPSRIFPGDSGTLTWGVMYGALAIVGEVEVVSIIAVMPAIINSFFFLSTVKRVIEHRAIKARPVILLDDYRLMASKERDAPITLVRLILAHGPMSENDIAKSIMLLTIFSSALAVLSSVFMSVIV